MFVKAGNCLALFPHYADVTTYNDNLNILYSFRKLDLFPSSDEGVGDS
jgi:hypothetical protein